VPQEERETQTMAGRIYLSFQEKKETQEEMREERRNGKEKELNYIPPAYFPR